MTDSRAAVSRATSHRNGSAHRVTPTRTLSASRAQRPTSIVHSNQSSSQSAQATSSAPRSRSRPAPVRSLSSPLGRSNSVRVSKKERRWSERLTNPTSPTTYSDHYKNPDQMSDKLRSLNLEVETTPSRPSPSSTPSSNGGTSDTTYEQSFNWPRWRGATSFRMFAPDVGEKGLKKSAFANDDCSPQPPVNNVVSNGQERPAAKPTTQTSGSSKGSRSNGSSVNTDITDSKPSDAVHAKTNGPFNVTNDRNLKVLPKVSNTAKQSSRNGTSSSSQTAPETGAKPQTTNGTKSLSKTSNADGPLSQKTSQSYRTCNGISGSNIFSPASDNNTPVRSRAQQYKSSSPFVYGSDSGSWV